MSTPEFVRLLRATSCNGWIQSNREDLTGPLVTLVTQKTLGQEMEISRRPLMEACVTREEDLLFVHLTSSGCSQISKGYRGSLYRLGASFKDYYYPFSK